MNFLPIAMAHADTSGGGSPDAFLIQLLPLVLIFGIFYFLLIRPQSKKAKDLKALIAAVGKGDEVVTSGGLAGRVLQAGEEYLHLEVSEGVTVKVLRTAVTLVLPKGTLKKL